MPNLCRKTRPADDPYEVWDMGNMYYLVLAKQRGPEQEEADPFARWTVRSVGEYCETGDMYAAEVKRYGIQVPLDLWNSPDYPREKYS